MVAQVEFQSLEFTWIPSKHSQAFLPHNELF